MSCQHTLDEWTTILHTQFPRLSHPQATVLALALDATTLGTHGTVWAIRGAQLLQRSLSLSQHPSLSAADP